MSVIVTVSQRIRGGDNDHLRDISADYRIVGGTSAFWLLMKATRTSTSRVCADLDCQERRRVGDERPEDQATQRNQLGGCLSAWSALTVVLL